MPNVAFVHQVARGECLYTIAKKYGITTDALLKANPTALPLTVGQLIMIPRKEVE